MYVFRCGDGVIFEKNAGFVVKGKVARSPFFKAFKIIEETSPVPGVKFSCSFTTCNNTCDGVSRGVATTSLIGVRQEVVPCATTVIRVSLGLYHV